MDDFLNKYGQWGLIAGSAEGLGEAWSRTLAGKKMNLVMVDFKEDVLSKLAQELQQDYGIETLQVVQDLAKEDAADVMMDAIRHLDCRLLVYNAAYSIVQPFLKNSRDDLDRYIHINMKTLIRLTLPFAEKCKAAGGGGMIFMSSLAALWGTRLLGPYGATKAFDYILAEALHHELKPFGIDVMACIAGATATPAYLGTHPNYGWPRPSVMQPQTVTDKAVEKLGRKATYIPGISNRFNYFLLSRVFPRNISRRLFNDTTTRMYRDRF